MKKSLLIIAFVALAATSHSQKVRVVGNSLLAKVIAKINHEDSYGVTIGRTIFVSCKKEDFYAKKWWVKHEMTHVAQYEEQGGTFRFLSKYLFYSVFHHKSVNPFELEAEVAEHSDESTATSALAN